MQMSQDINSMTRRLRPFWWPSWNTTSSGFDYHAGAGASPTSVGLSPGNWLAAHSEALTLG